MTTVELLLPLIAEYGLPIMITLYLLHRFEQKLDQVVIAIEQLQTKVTIQQEHFKKTS